MAYNDANEIRKELLKLKKNDRGEYIVITEITNNTSGVCNIDIRQFYTAENDELRPTQKGVRFNAENLEEVVEALKAALI